MVLERLEALPLGRFHYKLLLVTGLGWLFDSMDTGSSPLSCLYWPKNGAWHRGRWASSAASASSAWPWAPSCPAPSPTA
ncbi:MULTISPECIES: hypothetical protein [unclassified Megasphaera]|uniref:hypothetical protein n=1 Tax=unclassified Megasphaera TaxID=2626256 RepID=UPI0011CA4E61